MKIEEKNGNFVITDFNQFEAYRIAARIEKDGVDFYEKLAQKVDDNQTRKTLELLASEEVRHLRTFEYLLTEARQVSEDESEDNDLLTSMDFGIFKAYQNLEELESIIADSKKAIKVGIEVEAKSIAFYESCQKALSSDKAKQEVAKIINEEYKHKGLLEDMLRAIK